MKLLLNLILALSLACANLAQPTVSLPPATALASPQQSNADYPLSISPQTTPSRPDPSPLQLFSGLDCGVVKDSARLRWQLDPKANLADWEQAELVVSLPAHFSLRGATSTPLETAPGTVRFNFQQKGELDWDLDPDAPGPFEILAEVVRSGKTLASARISLDRGVIQSLPVDGGTVSSPDGRVTVEFPAGALAEPASICLRPRSDPDAAPLSPSGTPFTITAESLSSRAVLTRFAKALTLRVKVDPARYAEDEGQLALAYYDENLGSWSLLPSFMYRDRREVVAFSDHLTGFDLNVNTWQAARLPSTAAFQTSAFTGAATYALPFDLPAGPGGLKPDLALSYNSQVAEPPPPPPRRVGWGWGGRWRPGTSSAT